MRGVAVGLSTFDGAVQIDVGIRFGEHFVAVNVFADEEFESVYPFSALGRVRGLERALV